MANVKHNLLSAAKVKALDEPGDYTDGATLLLSVSDKGNKSWVQRISIEGRQRKMGLGSYPAVGLAEARKRAQDNARAIREGRNPIEERRAARKEAKERSQIKTFWEITLEVIERNESKWRSPKTKQIWLNGVNRFAVPHIGNKRPRDITTEDIAKILKPIWLDKRETADRLRQQMSATFEHARKRKWCTENPASNDVLDFLPRRPKREKTHHPSMPYTDLPAALNTVRDSHAKPFGKLAIEFLALTAGRVGEVRKATWDEIDLSKKTWTIPGERMKAGKEHRIPLPDRADEILEKAARIGTGEGLLFPNPNRGKPYSDATFSKLFRDLGIPSVPHGVRSCFKNWTMEQPYPDHVMAEIALAHTVGNEVERAYATSDMFEKRRVLMQEWSDFLASGMERSRLQQTTLALI